MGPRKNLSPDRIWTHDQDHCFVSVVGSWYQYYLAFNCGFEFFYYWWWRISCRNWLFTMSMRDLMSDNGWTTAHEQAETPDEKAMGWPQAYSTMLGAYGKESGYSTKENGLILLWKLICVFQRNLGMEKKTWNRTGILLKEDSQS